MTVEHECPVHGTTCCEGTCKEHPKGCCGNGKQQDNAPSWRGSRQTIWCNPWKATIWVGRKVLSTQLLIPEYVVKAALQNFVERGLCVSMTPTEFIYTGGSEPGFAIGLIQYPRFPKPVSELEDTALELAGLLRKVCQQERVSVEMPDYTVMLFDQPQPEEVPCP